MISAVESRETVVSFNGRESVRMRDVSSCRLESFTAR